MIELIKSVKNEPSKNAKVEILKGFADQEFLKEVLEYTYNPFKIFYLKKIKPVTSDYKYELSRMKWSDYVKPILNSLEAREITGNIAIEETEKMLSMFNKEAQELIIKIIKKDLKAGFNVRTANIVFPKLIPEFKVQLANKYTDFMKKDKKMKAVTKFYASAKLDGLRCVYINGSLWTRNGKPIVGFDHIIEDLDDISSRKQFQLIDGELYSHTIPFQQIQGIVMRNKNIRIEEKLKIKFNVFAMVHEDHKKTADMIADMLFYEGRVSNSLTFLRQGLVENDIEKIKALDKKFVARGYEGVMLRSVDTPYEWKRSDALLKYKSFIEEDFEIVGTYEGKEGTKYEGMMGGIVIKGKYNGFEVNSECGSGWNDEQREHYWKNQNELIGKKAEIKFQGLTDDNSSLRFPIFLKLKEDR